MTAAAPVPVAAAAQPGARALGGRLARCVFLVPARIRRGRPGHLALRVVGAVLLGLATALSGAGGPATVGVLTGLAVWLVLTGRGDLAPPPGR